MFDDVGLVVLVRRDPHTGAVERRAEPVHYCPPWRTLDAEAAKRARQHGMEIESVAPTLPATSNGDATRCP